MSNEIYQSLTKLKLSIVETLQLTSARYKSTKTSEVDKERLLKLLLTLIECDDLIDSMQDQTYTLQHIDGDLI